MTAAIKALKKQELEEKIRKDIRQLMTSGWKEAREELIKQGEKSVPFLIEAMAVPEDATKKPYELNAYQLQGPIRPTHQRPISEIVYDVLHDMILNYSNYKGKIPNLDQKAWSDFWSQNAAEIKFGTRMP